MVLAGIPAKAVAKEVRESAQNCEPRISEEQINTVLELAEARRVPDFSPQNFGAFMKRNFPPKDALIEGVLYKRDLISLTGRRRHGKTLLLSNIGMAGASGRKEYLGYQIARPFTTVSFYLEDDGGELQARLRRQQEQEPDFDASRFHLYIRQDFLERRIKIDFADPKFKSYMLAACEAAKPDLIIFDNLGMLIGADYNSAPKIHALMELVFELTQRYNAAILIAAHPKKGNKLDSAGNPISLHTDTEKFFEECMGSSHFINSTGSLWGIERDRKSGRTDLLLGAQRAADTESFTMVEKNDADWLTRVDDLAVARAMLLNTPQRIQAWNLIPAGREFSYVEARNLVKPAMKSNGSFNPWWQELLRNRLILESDTDQQRYKKAAATSAPSTGVAGGQPAQTAGNSMGDGNSPGTPPEYENRRPSRPTLKTKGRSADLVTDPDRPNRR
jgi:hypothetical protein